MFHKQGNLRQRTFRFGRRIARVFEALPRKRLADEYGRQLIRSGNSIGANYREAQRARSTAEYRAKLGDCLKEADETLYWLESIEADGLLPGRRLSAIKNECDQIMAILVSLLKVR